jgi:predicted ArsR family transcriptional regulator
MGVTRSTLRRVLGELDKSERIRKESGAGRTPTRYWLASQDDNQLPEEDEEFLPDTSDDNEK